MEDDEEEESLFMTPPPEEVRSPEKLEPDAHDATPEQDTNYASQNGSTEVQVKTISSDEDDGPMEPPERAPEPVNYEAMLNSLGPTLDDIDAKREDPADKVPNPPGAAEAQEPAEVDAWNALNREENFYKDDEVDDWEPPELPDNDSDEDFVMVDSDDNDDRPLSQFIGPKNSQAYLQTVVRSQPLKKPVKEKVSSRKRKPETPQKTKTKKKAKVTPNSAPTVKSTSTKKKSEVKKQASPTKPSPKKKPPKKDKELKTLKEDDDQDSRAKRMSSEFRKLESSLVGKLFDLPSGGRRRSARY